MTFTKQDIADWKAYECVRKGGRYNMIADCLRAIRASKLSANRYWFCVKNYSALKAAAEKKP